MTAVRTSIGVGDLDDYAFGCAAFGTGGGAELGLPLLDADGMGRAFPELQMISMNVAGVPPGVVTIADALGNTGNLSPADPAWAERWTRALCVASGSSAVMADYVMTAHEARGAVVEGSVTRAVELGARARMAADPIGEMVDVLNAVRVITGKVADVDKTTKDGFVLGTILIAGLGPDAGREVVITVQNECLAVGEDSTAIATVPDLISLFDTARGDAVPIEAVRFGHRVAVLAWPCDPLWRSRPGHRGAPGLRSRPHLSAAAGDAWLNGRRGSGSASTSAGRTPTPSRSGTMVVSSSPPRLRRLRT